MSVEVNSIDETHIEVNGKMLYKDGENWITSEELTTQETNAFHRHMVSLKRQQEAEGS